MLHSERQVASRYLAQGLHEVCPSRPKVQRSTSRAQRAEPMGNPTGLSFFTAKRRLKNPSQSEDLRALGAAAQHLPAQQLRALLEAATPHAATLPHIQGAQRLIQSAAFLALPANARMFLIRSYRALIDSDVLRESVLRLLEVCSFQGLGPEQQMELLRYAVGPKAGAHAHPEHRSLLQKWWAQRTNELRRFMSAPVSWEQCHSFLHEMGRPLHLLRTRADLNLHIFVLGRVSDPRALSYCRTVVEEPSGHIEAAVLSPDPRVASGWRGADRISRHAFECRTTELSRAEELELIRWIEQNHAVAPTAERRPGNMPFGVFLNARRLHDEFEQVLRTITAVRGQPSFRTAKLFRGRPRKGRTLKLKF